MDYNDASIPPKVFNKLHWQIENQWMVTQLLHFPANHLGTCQTGSIMSAACYEQRQLLTHSHAPCQKTTHPCLPRTNPPPMSFPSRKLPPINSSILAEEFYTIRKIIYTTTPKTTKHSRQINLTPTKKRTEFLAYQPTYTHTAYTYTCIHTCTHIYNTTCALNKQGREPLYTCRP